MSYKLSISLEPTEIHGEMLYEAQEESNGTNKTKYITKDKMSQIMKHLFQGEELDFVRNAVGMFRGEKIVIEEK
jgi:hypothetical protein